MNIFLQFANNNGRKVGRYMKVRDCMNTNLVYAEPQCTVWDIAKLMNEKHVGSVVICNPKKELSGITTDRDIVLRGIACEKNMQTTPISEIMTTKVITATPEDDVTNVMQKMAENQIRRLPVIENGKIVGMVTLKDLANTEDVTGTKVGETFEEICGCGCEKHQKNAE